MRSILLSALLSVTFASAAARIITIDPGRQGPDIFAAYSTGYADAVDGDTVVITPYAQMLPGYTGYEYVINKGITLIGFGYDHAANYPAAMPQGFQPVQLKIRILANSPVELIGIDAYQIWIGNLAPTILRSVKISSSLFCMGVELNIVNCKINDVYTSNSTTLNVLGSFVANFRELYNSTGSYVNPVIIHHSVILGSARPNLVATNSFVKGGACQVNNTIEYSVIHEQLCSGGTNLYVPSSTPILRATYLSFNIADSLLQLAPNSPAIGAGFNGVDIGMFDGPEPYVLSGIPPFPWIYEFTVPPVYQAPATTTQVRVKVRAID